MSKSKPVKSLGVIIAIVLTMQLGLLGCTARENNDSTTAAPTTAQTTAVTTAESPTKDFVKLSWYIRKPVDNIKDQDIVEAEVNKIIKEKINANLKFNLVDTASWEEKMKLMSASGEEYDLVFTAAWTNHLSLNVQRGALRPIDDLLDKYGTTIKEKVDPRAWQSTTYNGKIMAIPNQSPYTQPMGFVFKKDLVEKYNFDYKSVKTFCDLEPYLETIKKNEPGITPLLATAKNPPPGVDNVNVVSISQGVVFNEKTGKMELAFEVPESNDLGKKINDYYKKGYIAKDAATKTDTMAEAKSGKYAVLRDSGGYSGDGSKPTAMYGFPCVEALYAYQIISNTNMSTACTAISNTSKNPERAMMLLELVWSDKVLLNTMAFGVEGKNYIVEEGKGTDNPKVKANTGAEQTWAIWHNWLGPLWDSWDSNWNTAAALKTMQENNANAKASATLGFTFNNENVKTEVAQVSAAYAAISPIQSTGSQPDYDQFVADSLAKLKEAGIEKIKEEAQKQFDEWKKANGK